MVLEFSQQMKNAQITEKYIRLTFNSYISDDDFFSSKVYAHYRHELAFFLRFSRPRRGAPYPTVITVLVDISIALGTPINHRYFYDHISCIIFYILGL